jgi:outer membrane receptor for monomeric catechols
LGATPLVEWAQESLPAVTVTASKDKNGYVAATSASGSKTEMALRDVPQTINVVPAAVIRDQNAMSIQDIMEGCRGEVDVGRVGETVDWRVTGARELSDSYREQQFINRMALAPSVAIHCFQRRVEGAGRLAL